MDGFNEKKWFVYMVDHHEGPFSLEEIQSKMGEGQVTTGSYVWAEGMADWKPMTEVEAFESLLAMGAGAVAAGTPAPIVMPSANALASTGPDLDVAADDMPEGSHPMPSAEAFADAEAHTHAISAPEAGSKKNKLLVPIGLTLAVVAGGAAYKQGLLNPLIQSPGVQAGIQTVSDLTRPHVLTLIDKIPALAGFLSPIPRLDDVSAEDLALLKAAASQPLHKAGPKVAIVLSRGDLLAPRFYVSTNLPDGAQFDVVLEGIPDTLLNQTQFQGQARVTIEKRMAKTVDFRFQDGRPIPRGEYLVYVAESANQPEALSRVLDPLAPTLMSLPQVFPKGRRLVAKKGYFLGGPKDQVYAARLKEYHDKLRQKAEGELAEIKQFAMTLENQLTGSRNGFGRIRRGKVNRAQQKSWGDFNTKWVQLDNQLRETFNKWTPEALQHEYFYGPLYLLVQQAGQSIAKVHNLHHAYFTGSVDTKAFDIQVGEAISVAESSINALRAKIQQAESIPPTPNGMPRKDGL